MLLDEIAQCLDYGLMALDAALVMSAYGGLAVLLSYSATMNGFWFLWNWILKKVNHLVENKDVVIGVATVFVLFIRHLLPSWAILRRSAVIMATHAEPLAPPAAKSLGRCVVAEVTRYRDLFF
eukprot:SAG31_NODE_9546_length_1260_cov_1.373816_1_plen_123_part_00